MSRTPGASCLQDVRTTAILQDYIITTNNCAPGVAIQLARRNKLGGIGLLENCEPPACGFDRPRDILSVLASAIIIATTVGIVHTFAVFIPSYALEYDAGFLELCIVAAITYLMMLLSTCAAYPIIEYAGHKLTALFGMIFMFCGILIDSQVFHISCLYFGNVLLVGVGSGLAYAASMTIPADLFRKKLTMTLIINNIAGSVGTIFYTWLCAFVLDMVGFKWTKLLQAVLVLFFTLSVHVFPKTRLMYASNCNPAKRPDHTDKVRDCVYKSAIEEAEDRRQQARINSNPNCEEEQETQKNLLCVCVCDLRLYGDKSFMLWACLVLVATMNFQLPYLCIMSFAETSGAQLSYWYITVFCLGSMVGRCAFISNIDFTFPYNRAIFQGCVFVSGIMWIVINWAVTFGWIMVCCFIMGAIEGVICIVTSRVALGTIPRRWLSGAWLTCIILHAIGIFAMAIFTSVIALRTYHYAFAFVTSGIIQVIVSLLATLLPSEEEDAPPAAHDPHAHGTAAIHTTTYHGVQSKPTFQSHVSSFKSSIDLSRLCRGYVPGSYRTYSLSNCCGGSGLAGLGLTTTLGSRYVRSAPVSVPLPPKSDQYKCQCAICRHFGCIPGCLPDCTPGGSLHCKDGLNP